ncbi:unnamed protein product [Enterobius vermicularis]|uniref:Astacin domain-containing protein n=1 Tax=Enterobius vermicularis TaxID=51028 RepID=A0A0N4V924_ENTVE|nr:unnamed protein product [Enterobius vermicularis]
MPKYSNAVVGEQYWTVVNRDGTLPLGRSSDEFIRMDSSGSCSDLRNAFVAFWSVNDHFGHYETFGQAHLENNQVCAQFSHRDGSTKRLCGGFRILSRSKYNQISNPFIFVRAEQASVHDAVTYLGKQPAKLTNRRTGESFYGTAKISEKIARGVDKKGDNVEVIFLLSVPPSKFFCST